MTKKIKVRPKAPRRLRSEIIEMAGDLNAVGIMSDDSFEKITMRMLDKDKLPKVACLSGAEIRQVRERAGLSQAVFARYLNLTASYVSQLERGDKRPSGATAKLLDVVRRKGIETIL
ncbi:MAG TPA: helix-turn-helix domain-containing protein [Hyphomicrobiaceae bacterium]|nr:helix-turn-helix domain-containing protein [Hyphomicrobiaceae bacterium]